MASSKKIKTLLLSWALITASISARGEVVFLPEFSDFDFNVWNGQGNVTLSQSTCILSYSGNIFNRRDYRLRASMNAPAPSPSTSYRLYNSADSNYSIPFSLESRDLHAGSGFELLSADIFSNLMTYQGCYIGGSGANAELTLSILASDMYQVPAGVYEVDMDIEARRVNGSGGLTGDGATQTGLRGTIEVPSLIQISGLDDIPFGSYDGVSASVTQNEEFCIYTNTSAYTVTPSSTTVGTNPGSFALDSNGNRIEYTVRVDNAADASSGPLLTNGQQSSALLANQPTPLSVNCNNSDNAGVYLEFSGPELQAAPPGDYSGVLTLMVSPI